MAGNMGGDTLASRGGARQRITGLEMRIRDKRLVQWSFVATASEAEAGSVHSLKTIVTATRRY